MIRKLLLTAGLGVLAMDASAKASFGTTGQVSSIVSLGDKVFVSGNFRHVGPLAPYAGSFDRTTAKADLRAAKPDGIVRCVVGDGSGGWYIGGTFQKVGGMPHANLAHILPDGSVDSWNPQVHAGMQGITAMAIHQGRLYIGGEFYSIGGMGSSIGTTMYQRMCMASFDLATGMPTAFAPNPNNVVRAIAVHGSKVYAGGDFTMVDNWSVSRSRLAAFDTATGAVSSWAPAPDARVNTIAVCGPKLIVGGEFGSFSGGFGLNRGRIAMLDTVTGAVSNWNPDIWGNRVSTVVVEGSKVFVGGYFHTINNSSYSRDGLALLDTNSNLPLSWNPQLGNYGEIFSMQFLNGKLYAAGSILNNTITYAASGVAEIDSATGVRQSWDPRIGGTVYSVAVQGNSVYATGDYLVANTVDRAGMAAYYTQTGEVAPWNPGADNLVQSLTAAGNKIYAAGYFTTVNGNVTRNHLAAFDTAAGTVTSWNPNTDYVATKVAHYGGRIYAIGSFTQVNGAIARNYAASFDTLAGTATSWDPNADNWISDFSISGKHVFLGGGFRNVNGNISRYSLAAVDTATGTATAWDPYTDGSVNVVHADGDKVYVGGSFSRVERGNVMREKGAAFDTAVGIATPWNPRFDNQPYKFVRHGDFMYAAGDFINVNGNVPRRALAQFDTTGGTATTWNPYAGYQNSYVYINSLLPTNGGIYVGGEFTQLGLMPQSNFSALSVVTATPLSTKLETFTAVRQGAVNEIRWKAKIAPADMMQLEKSADGSSFSTLVTLSGADATGSYIDAAPYHGATHYRLRMLSASGGYSFSPVVTVRGAEAAVSSVTLAPVPATTQLRITNTDAASNGRTAHVVDLQGREMARFSLQPALRLDIAAWPAGSYFVKLPDGTNLRFVKH